MIFPVANGPDFLESRKSQKLNNREEVCYEHSNFKTRMVW